LQDEFTAELRGIFINLNTYFGKEKRLKAKGQKMEF